MTINIAGRWSKKEEVSPELPDTAPRDIKDWGLCIEFKGADDLIAKERKVLENEIFKYLNQTSTKDPKYHLTQADAFAGGYYLYANNPQLLSDEDAVDEAWIQEVIYGLAEALDEAFGKDYSVDNLLVEDQKIFDASENIVADAQDSAEEPSSPRTTQTFLRDAQEPLSITSQQEYKEMPERGNSLRR